MVSLLTVLCHIERYVFLSPSPTPPQCAFHSINAFHLVNLNALVCVCAASLAVPAVQSIAAAKYKSFRSIKIRFNARTADGDRRVHYVHWVCWSVGMHRAQRKYVQCACVLLGVAGILCIDDDEGWTDGNTGQPGHERERNGNETICT